MIRLFSVSGVRVECSIIMLLLSFAALVYSGAERVAAVFISLTLHEAAHTLTATRLGYRVASLEIQPFGFVARLAGDFGSFGDELRVAAAGPVTSAVAACAAFAAGQYLGGGELTEWFASFNLSLTAVNLLPVLPLDGGRMLRAVIGRAGRSAVAALSWLGVLTGVLLGAAGVWLILNGAPAFTPLLMGAFLIPASLRELKKLDSAAVNAVIKRSETLRRGGCVDVRHAAVSADTTVLEAIRMLSSGRYTVLIVVDGGLRAVGSVDEGRLLRAMSLYGGAARLGDVMRRAD